jgi:hypothetical protein
MNSLILAAALMGSPCDGECRTPVRNVVAVVAKRVQKRPLLRKARARLHERPLLRRVRGRLFRRCH